MSAVQQALLGYGAAAAVGSPPTSITGISGWWDFTDAAYLYTDTGVTVVVSDGALIQFAKSKASGTQRAVYQINNANKPVYKTNIVNGKSVARADGTTTTADYNNFDNTGPPPSSTGRFLENGEAWTTTAKTLIVAVTIPSAIADSGGAYANSMIVGDSAVNRFGLSSYNVDGSNVMLQAYNYDGSFDYASLSAAKNTWYIISVKHDGTNLKIRKNHGAWTSVVSGTTNTLSGGPTFAKNGAARGTFDMAHCATFAAAVSDADIYLVEQYMADQLGITLS